VWYNFRMLSYFKRIAALDYRSIATLRIFVGITLFLDLIQRSHSLRSHYTDAGVLPRDMLFSLWQEPLFWSVYNINGATIFTGALFILAGVFAIMMVVGYKTRIATISSFILLLSLHTRNPMVLQGGDVALRVVLFFMIFMPLAKRFSLDVILGNIKSPETKEYVSIFGAVYIAQFLLVWVISGWLKTNPVWTTEFTAVAMALALDTFTTNFGHYLRTMPNFLYYITIVTITVERYAFVMFFAPHHRDYFRLLGLILFTILICGFNLSFRLGLFGTIMFSISLGLLPPLFWDKIITPLHAFLSSKSSRGITIFYDGDCGFCSRISNVTRKLLLLHPDTVVTMSLNNAEAEQLMHTAHSWVVRDRSGINYTGFRAFVTLMQSAFVYRIIAPVFLLGPIMYFGELIYRLISHNRPMTCSVHLEEVKKNNQEKIIQKIGVALIGLLGATIIFWNLLDLDYFSNRKKPIFVGQILTVLRLDQRWGMFGPYPSTEDGFYVIPGNLRDETVVNVYTGQETISYEKPYLTAWTYQDQRWQKYMMNLWLQDYTDYRLGYGQYLCREWNSKNSYDKNLMNFKIIYMLENTDFDTLEESKLQPNTIWEHDCFS